MTIVTNTESAFVAVFLIICATIIICIFIEDQSKWK